MNSQLFSPLTVGALTLPNRIVMAPMTRARAGTTHVPNALMAEYYSQRASAGLILTECSMIAADGCAFTGEGGIFDDATMMGWKQVVDAVHDQGGRIAMQIWHAGRASHSALNHGTQPISSGNQAIRHGEIGTPIGNVPYEVPRALATEELPGIVELFRQAAERAKAAGFDGVQIHGAHGYLIDQFLRDSVNDRSDTYGGSIENRARLLLEVTDAAISVFGAGLVSVRISPLVAFNDMADSNPKALVKYVAEQLSIRNIAFLELRHEQHDLPEEIELAKIARAHFKGILILNGGFTQASGEEAIASGLADAISYGKPFIANPDLVERFTENAPLNAVDFDTLYCCGAHGYTDYLSLKS